MKILDLGRMGYEEAWAKQLAVVDDVMQGEEDTLIFVEHPPVLTLGASFHERNLLHTREEYAQMGIEVVRTDRGGDVTFHGPGQLVIYPVFDLKRHGQDLHKWMRDLEGAVIIALSSFELPGFRFPPHTGVWTGSSKTPRKIAAIGVKIKKWVSLHGIALNCTNDLQSFNLIVPCGIVGYGVTSVSRETGSSVDPDDAKGPIERAFKSLFTEQVRS